MPRIWHHSSLSSKGIASAIPHFSGHAMNKPTHFPTISRREAIRLGICSSAGALLTPLINPVFADAATTNLITKTIPSTGQKLTCVGIGTNSFTIADVPNLQAVLKRMNELGGNFIDTASAYRESEAAIGTALNNLNMRNNFFVSTKISGGEKNEKKMGDLGGVKSFARSLDRLKTDKVDLLMVHNMLNADGLMPQLLEWKKAGKVRYIGMTTAENDDHAQLVAYMKKYPLDFVEVNYSIANREAEETVLPTALDKGVAVVINLPFGGKHEENLFLNNTRILPEWAADIGCSSWSEFLLKFVISHPAVTVAIPGTTKMAHMESNIRAAHGELPDAVMRKRMVEAWNS